MTKRRTLVLATHNKDKVAEFIRSPFLSRLPVRIVGLDAYPDAPEAEETGDTFAANASLKARLAAKHTGQWALADDSGLEVDALEGRPGVHSARFSGPRATAASNNGKLLELLKEVPPEKRTARFCCAIAIASPTGTYWVDVGVCEGFIADEPRGEGGFGYDPLFVVPEYDRTFAELPAKAKDDISHRARALRKAAARLQKLWALGDSVL